VNLHTHTRTDLRKASPDTDAVEPTEHPDEHLVEADEIPLERGYLVGQEDRLRRMHHLRIWDNMTITECGKTESA
jgi:hypothetical protein